MTEKRVAVIINPISGTGGRMQVARERAELAASTIAQRGFDVRVFITERRGHAHELAGAAVAEGASTVIAWGGDGTVNEVGAALAFREATLGVVPSGSGNGLAREVGIPFDPAAALAIAVEGRRWRVDAGELDGRLFFNVAGIGLDASVAHQFASRGLGRRGFSRYLAITARELFRYQPHEHTVVTDGQTQHVRAMLIAIANARQYGNGALIAPAARLDDGRLDVVVIAARSPLRALMHVPRIFTGQIASVPGVSISPAVEIGITSGHPVLYHVDGEPYVGPAAVAARPRPGALILAVPN